MLGAGTSFKGILCLDLGSLFKNPLLFPCFQLAVIEFVNVKHEW